MISLTLAADPNHNEQIDGTFTVTDGGVLTVLEKGLVPRIYSPTAWLRIEDFTESKSATEAPVIDGIRTL